MKTAKNDKSIITWQILCVLMWYFSTIWRWNYASSKIWIWPIPWQGFLSYVFVRPILLHLKVFISYLISCTLKQKSAFSMITENKTKRIFAAYLLAILNKIKYCLVILREFITLKLECLFWRKKIQNKIHSFLVKFIDPCTTF